MVECPGSAKQPPRLMTDNDGANIAFCSEISPGFDGSGWKMHSNEHPEALDPNTEGLITLNSICYSKCKVKKKNAPHPYSNVF